MTALNRLALLLLACLPLPAQYVLNTHSGTVHFATGQVLIDGKPVVWSPLQFPQLAQGQVLSTTNGRAEILLGPGVFLRLGERAAIRMLDTRLEAAEVEILQGTALVEVVEIPNGSDVHVRLGPTRTGFSGIGLHRFDAASSQLSVFGGRAAVVAGSASVEATRGKVVRLDDPPSQSKFNPRKKDRLLVWAAQRSFDIYRSNPLASFRQTNWERREISPPIFHGDITDADRDHIVSDRDHIYFYNRDFDQMFVGQRGIIPPPVTLLPAPVNSQNVPLTGTRSQLIAFP